MNKKNRYFAIVFLAILLVGCNTKNKNDVIIFSSAENFRNEYILAQLKEKFPSYNITLQYFSTGNNAAKLKAEEKKTECDIVLGLEAGYMENLLPILADLSSYNTEMYLDNIIPSHRKYLVWERYSGCIALNNSIIKKHNLSVPASYKDLLKAEYKNLISMPNPKSSGTGYIFLKNLVNAWGEENAFDYFDKLSNNILQYTSSGAGPINALIQGEGAIALGMTFQAANEANKGVDISIYYFNEGAPFTLTGYGIIDGKQDRKAVKDVFNYIYTNIIYEDKTKFSPEQIFSKQENNIPNYPNPIPYGNMSNNTLEEKTRLLKKWKY